MKYTEKIQRYLDGNMSGEELKKFRQDLQRDPELMRELDLHHFINDTVGQREELRFREKLNDVYKDYDSKRKKKPENFKRNKLKNIIYYLSIASVVIFFLIYTFLQQPVSPDQIFEKYYAEFRTDLQSRSYNAFESSLLSEGIQQYLKKEYKKSTESIQKYIDMENENLVMAYFYKGLANIELGETGKAIQDFLFISGQEFNYNTEHSLWYLALCYLKEDKISLAREELLELVNMGSVYSREAEKILKKLRE